MFDFIRTCQAFCFKKSDVVLRELIPSVPLMASVVIFVGLGAVGGTLISRCPWFGGLWIVLLVVVSGSVI